MDNKLKVTDKLTLQRQLKQHCQNDAECKRLAKQARLYDTGEPEPMPRNMGNTVPPSTAVGPKP